MCIRDRYVQLHVYTTGLYGHILHLKLIDYKNLNKELTFDQDVDETNNDDLTATLVRQVKIYRDAEDASKRMQKAIFTVYLEHRWMRLASSRFSDWAISIGGVLGVQYADVPPKELSATLKVKNKSIHDTHADSTSKSGNRPTIVGEIMTDVAHFNPCRYEEITKKYTDTDEQTIFSIDQRINHIHKIIDIGVVASPDASKTLEIKVGEADVEHCHKPVSYTHLTLPTIYSV